MTDLQARSLGEPVEQRIFRVRGDQRYSLELLPVGIEFFVDRLRRSHQETVGELTVSLTNGNAAKAKTITGGVLSRGNFNFSSVQTRATLAKLLSSRSTLETLDWHGFLEEFAIKVLEAERKGAPAIVLADEPEPEDDTEAWSLDGFPVLQEHPMVVFGRGGAGKSYFAMWIAGKLAQIGVPVLYADWEFSEKAHRKRFGRLFQPMPRNLHYVICDRPIQDEAERLVALIHEHRIKYVVCDSMVFALAGKAEDSDQAGIYFRTVRQFKVGSLHLAHTTKADDDKEKQVFGSVFFTNGARSVWFLQRTEENPQGSLHVGLYHRKSNVGELLKPLAYQFLFRGPKTLVEKATAEDVDELAEGFPLADRMKRLLKQRAMSMKALASELGTKPDSIRKVVSRHSSLFVKIGDKVGLKAVQEEPEHF